MDTPKKFESNLEFFNAAYNWLITENRPCCYKQRDGGRGIDIMCLYRKSDGTTCVIGAFIPDELLPLGEKTDGGIFSLMKANEAVRKWFEHINTDLLVSVQAVHDNTSATLEERKNTMEIVRGRFNLLTPNLL